MSQHQRVLSGMRSTGALHLGHYHGVLKNWLTLQHEYECYFFAADWHALTTHYEQVSTIEASIWEMFIDWLAVGVNPSLACLFIQSRVPEHAELHLLLSMTTPLSWLTRVPTYKEQQQQLKDKDLSTYGFLGYPLLQAADILIYKAAWVPVGEDQVAHVELCREIARRFNHLYGRDTDFEEKSEQAIIKMGKKASRLYRKLRKAYLEQGDDEALLTGQALLKEQSNLTLGDRERLLGFLEGNGRLILPEPQPLLTETAKAPGTDGQKMSKSYDNTIAIRESADSIEKKIKTMPTDPARVRRTDPGDPDKCPVFELHKIYSTEEVQQWATEGCRSAGIGCLGCKEPLIDAVLAEQAPICERAKMYTENPSLVRNIVAEGCEKARDVARTTLVDVRQAMGLNYY